MELIEERIEVYLEESKSKLDVLRYREENLKKSLSEKGGEVEKISSRLEVLKMSSNVLQMLIEKVSKQNILKIEELVNRALANIFYDLDLKIEIKTEPKRNNTQYEIFILQGNRRGGVNSYGGGVVCVIALVLKFIFNILSKSFPLLGFDETLAFVYEGYIPHASQFIKELSKEFSLPVFMSTHQTFFCERADMKYTIKGDDGNKSIIFPSLSLEGKNETP